MSSVAKQATRLSIACGTVALLVSVALLTACSPLTVGLTVTSDAAMLGAATLDQGPGFRSVQTNFAEERGVDVSLLPYNWKGAQDPKYFTVAVDFTSALKSAHLIEADFRQFTLNLPDDSVLRPIGYELTYPDVVSQGCRNGNGENSLPPFKPRVSYQIRPFPEARIKIRSNPWSIVSECYDLVFPIATLPPKTAFSIDVAGVFIDGTPMRRERVVFAQGPGR